MKKKTGTLATAFLLMCSFALVPSLVRADQDDWYQGRKGQWSQTKNVWQFRDSGGNVYRKHGNSWGWYNGRKHGAEGEAYHNRAPGNDQTYNQYQNTH